MNRIEYMTKLASLLQDIPEVERRDAMKYYNDYFDEAGEENEEQVIREFGAPEEVAENIKADLKGKTENTTHGQQEEYQSAGQQYQMNHQMNHQENKQSSEYQYGTSDDQKKKNARIGKIVLIVALAIIIGPVLIPIIGGILAAGLAMVLTIIVGVFALVIAGAAIAIVGISMVISGSVILLPQTAAGLALIGSGLIIMVLGVVATVGFGKLCEVVLRGLAKGMKYLWGKISHRKVVA